MTADGGSVFFDSTDSLVPQDKDGGFIDVYEGRPDGSVGLVSPDGAAQTDSVYLDNSADGSTVFIATAEQVLPQDVNPVRDVYAARAGGGFSLPPQPQNCEGDACQGSVTPPAATPRPGSGRRDATGGEQRPAAKPRQRLLKLTGGQRRALARRGRTQVGVRVSEAGMVAIAASARLKGRTVRLTRAWRRTAKGGVVRLPLALTSRARAHLRRHGTLRMTISATYSKTDKVVSQVAVLRG
jgi:hypothetical protein